MLDNTELKQLAAMLGEALSPRIREAVAENVNVRLAAARQAMADEFASAVSLLKDEMAAQIERAVEQARSDTKSHLLEALAQNEEELTAELGKTRELLASTTEENESKLSSLREEIVNIHTDVAKSSTAFRNDLAEIKSTIPEPVELVEFPEPEPLLVAGELSESMRLAMEVATKQILIPLLDARVEPMHHAIATAERTLAEVRGVQGQFDECIDSMKETFAVARETSAAAIASVVERADLTLKDVAELREAQSRLASADAVVEVRGLAEKAVAQIAIQATEAAQATEAVTAAIANVEQRTSTIAQSLTAVQEAQSHLASSASVVEIQATLDKTAEEVEKAIAAGGKTAAALRSTSGNFTAQLKAHMAAVQAAYAETTTTSAAQLKAVDASVNALSERLKAFALSSDVEEFLSAIREDVAVRGLTHTQAIEECAKNLGVASESTIARFDSMAGAVSAVSKTVDGVSASTSAGFAALRKELAGVSTAFADRISQQADTAAQNTATAAAEIRAELKVVSEVIAKQLAQPPAGIEDLRVEVNKKILETFNSLLVKQAHAESESAQLVAQLREEVAASVEDVSSRLEKLGVRVPVELEALRVGVDRRFLEADEAIVKHVSAGTSESAKLVTQLREEVTTSVEAVASRLEKLGVQVPAELEAIRIDVDKKILETNEALVKHVRVEASESAKLVTRLHEESVASIEAVANRLEKLGVQAPVELEAMRNTFDEALRTVETDAAENLKHSSQLNSKVHAQFEQGIAVAHEKFSSLAALINSMQAAREVEDKRVSEAFSIFEGKIAGLMESRTADAQSVDKSFESLTKELRALYTEFETANAEAKQSTAAVLETAKGALVRCVELAAAQEDFAAELAALPKTAQSFTQECVASARSETQALIDRVNDAVSSISERVGSFSTTNDELRSAVDALPAHVEEQVRSLTESAVATRVEISAQLSAAVDELKTADAATEKRFSELMALAGEVGAFKKEVDENLLALGAQVNETADLIPNQVDAIRLEIKAGVELASKQFAELALRADEDITASLSAQIEQVLQASSASKEEVLRRLEDVDSFTRTAGKELIEIRAAGIAGAEACGQMQNGIATLGKQDVALAESVAAIRKDLAAAIEASAKASDFKASHDALIDEIATLEERVVAQADRFKSANDETVSTLKLHVLEATAGFVRPDQLEDAHRAAVDAAKRAASAATQDVLDGSLPEFEGLVRGISATVGAAAAVGALPEALQAQREALGASLAPFAEAAATPVAEQAAKAVAGPLAEQAAIAAVDSLRAELRLELNPTAAAARAVAEAVPDLVKNNLAIQLASIELRLLKEITANMQREIDRMPLPKDGKDARVVRPVAYEQGKFYDHGTWVAHDSGIWVAAMGTDDEPTSASPAWDCVAPGIKAIETVLQEDGRTIEIHYEMSDGALHSNTATLPVPVERGVYDAAAEYAKYDVITYDGSQWTAQRSGVLPRPPSPGSTDPDPAWKLRVKRGKDGKDLKQPPPHIIRYAAGHEGTHDWEPDVEYPVNTVVKHAGVFWLSMRSTRERPPFTTLVSNATWLKMGA